MLDTLPDPLILQIFNYLPPFDVAKAGQCCATLRRVAKDDLLWRAFFHRYFRVTPHFKEPVGYDTWRAEFIRLVDETPLVEAEVLTKHNDQVLHVSYSHNGKRFATTGKDGFVHVWKTGHPVALEYSYSMKRFSWKYTQYSQFNEPDTMLLVSGVLFGMQNTSGEIIIFNLTKGFQIQCRIINKPYDIFGTWYSDKYFFSGDLKWLGNLVSKSVIWINKASQETESEHVAIMNNIFRFYNPKASSVRSLIIANCIDSGQSSCQPHSSSCSVQPVNVFEENAKRVYDRTGNPPSHFNLPLERDLMRINSRGMRGTLQGAFQNWRPIDNVSDIGYTEEFHTKINQDLEREREGVPGSSGYSGSQLSNSTSLTSLEEESEAEGGASSLPPDNPDFPDNSDTESQSLDNSPIFNKTFSTELHGSRAESFKENTKSYHVMVPSPASNDHLDGLDRLFGNESTTPEKNPASTPTNTDDPLTGSLDEVEKEVTIDAREKWLIFTKGSVTYTPHQIGFKRIPPFKFKTLVDRGPSLQERVDEYKRRKLMEDTGEEDPENNLDYSDFESVAGRFDPIDCVLDMHGHIIGLTLSPDHRYLYVNSRPWPADYKISDPFSPPPIAQEIDIHVIDLITLKQVGMMRRAHRAYTPNDECFFIFLDASEYYLASGAEDKFGYLWDRHYGISLTKLPHTDVVNAVAFNPRESEMLITVSDDNTIKVWRSLRQCRKLGIKHANLTRGTKLYLKPRPSCVPGSSSSI